MKLWGYSMAAIKPLPPVPAMLVGMVASLVFVVLAASYLTSQPWLGLTLGYDESDQRPSITAVYRAELKSLIQKGDILRSIRTLDGSREVYLFGFVPGTEPPSFATFSEHNDYLRREDAIATILAAGAIQLEFQNREAVEIHLVDERPITTLPLDFWLFNLFGLLAWNIGLAVVAVRPGIVAARLLALSGFGFYVATLFNSIYLSREFALPESEFLTLSRLNHLGLSVMLFALLALMAYFPRKISRHSPLWVIFPVGVLVQLNEWLQWYEWPLHAYYLPILVLYLAGVWVAIYQWRRSRSSPLDRAALKWMLLSIFIIMGVGLSIYFVPIALVGEAIFPQWAMVGIASLLYIGFAFGIVRYRLFDVQRWWLKIWGWFLVGLAIVGLDLLMITVLKMQPMIALSVAVISIGWIYFPIRQVFLNRLARITGTDDRRMVDQVEAMAQTIPGRDSNSQWQQLLVNQFSPAGVDFDEETVDAVHLEHHGAVMAVPMVAGGGTLRLTYPDFGRRLFSLSDVDYVQSVLQISRRILAVHEVEIQAVKEERQRIVRDLHDDVGGHLLTLLRQAPSETYENLTRKALQALREAMKAMDGQTHQRLVDCLEDWRVELEQRVNDHQIDFSWRLKVSDSDTEITVRQAINISRILSESVSNALQHASPTYIRVQAEVSDVAITLRIENDGVASVSGERNVMRGRGLNNMLTRATELSGKFDFTTKGSVARAYAILPLTQVID